MNAPVYAGRGLGYVPDRHKKPGEAHDWNWTEHAPRVRAMPATNFVVPWSRDLIVAKGLPFDQGHIGSCVGNGWAGAWLGLQLHLGYPDAEQPARLVAYRGGRLIEGVQDFDAGTQVRDVGQWFRTEGAMRERYVPYTDGPGWNGPFDPALDRYAIDQGERSNLQFARVYDTGNARLEQIHQALTLGRPVIFGSDVSDQFCRCAFDATQPFDPTAGQVVGRHCEWLLPGSWRVEANGHASALVVNSWGPDVLDGGFWRITEEAMANKLGDVHVVIMVPRYTDQKAP